MAVSVRNFFKVGGFWAGLNGTIMSMKKVLKAHSKRHRETDEKIQKLTQVVVQLSKENAGLRKRFDKIDDKLWDLKGDDVIKYQPVFIREGSKQ